LDEPAQADPNGSLPAKRVTDIGQADNSAAEIKRGEAPSLAPAPPLHWERSGSVDGAKGLYRQGTRRDGKNNHHADADAESGGKAEPDFARKCVVSLKVPPGNEAKDGENEGVMHDAERGDRRDDDPSGHGLERFTGEKTGLYVFRGEKA
jgi:hypothetical protein